MMRKWKTAVGYFHGSCKWWVLSCTLRMNRALKKKKSIKENIQKSVCMYLQGTACWPLTTESIHQINTQVKGRTFSALWSSLFPPLSPFSDYHLHLFEQLELSGTVLYFLYTEWCKMQEASVDTIDGCSFVFHCCSPKWCLTHRWCHMWWQIICLPRSVVLCYIPYLSIASPLAFVSSHPQQRRAGFQLLSSLALDDVQSGRESRRKWETSSLTESPGCNGQIWVVEN